MSTPAVPFVTPPSSERSEENLSGDREVRAPIIQARQLTPDNRIQEFQLNKNLFFSLQAITRCCNFVFFRHLE